MKKRGWSVLDFAVVLGVAVLVLVAILVARGLPWVSDAREAQAAIHRFAATVAQYHERHGHLPGDANRDGEIDALEASYVAIDIAGRRVLMRLIARSASALPNAPRGRNVIELWGLPCRVARELDATTDDGNFAKGSLRASVAACSTGGENDPVPVLAVPAAIR
jgi:hypothetical protein